MKKIKAIQTWYAGRKFRSRLEARWAVFFDAMGYRWDYEPEGYELEGYGRYLPDFWLPDYKMFAEVKPEEQVDGDEMKIRELAVQSKTACVVLRGLPRFDYFVSTVWCRYVSGEVMDGFVKLDDRDNDGTFNFRELSDVACQSCHYRNEPWKRESFFSKRYRAAIVAAKSARFEFGESGAPR